MKRGGQMRKQSPILGTKISKIPQSKPVTTNTISLPEAEDGDPREEPSDEGKSKS